MTYASDKSVEQVANDRRRQRYYRNRRTVQRIEDSPSVLPLARMTDVDLLLEAHRGILEVWSILREGTSVEGMRNIRGAHDCVSALIERGWQLELPLYPTGDGESGSSGQEL
jgi:hypothetical protein